MTQLEFLTWTLIITLASRETVCAEDSPGPVRPAAVQHLISNSAADWQLKVQLNHADGIYSIGDRMKIDVYSPRECFVHIVNITPQGAVNVLWPMDDKTSNKVVSGHTVTFPDQGNHPNYVFEATAPVGKELVVCFATRTPLNLKSDEGARVFKDFLNEVTEVTTHPLIQLKSFVTRVEPEKSGWTAIAFELITAERAATASSDVVHQSLPSPAPEIKPAPGNVPPQAAPKHKPAVFEPPAVSEMPDPKPLSSSINTIPDGPFVLRKGNVVVQFPGSYRTEPANMEVISSFKVSTTLTKHDTKEGVLMFSATLLETQVESFDENVALQTGAADWKQRFQATDAQIQPIEFGHLRGLEYRGCGGDGVSKRLRLYVDPASRSSYVIGGTGKNSFIEGPVVAAFLESFQIIN